MILKFSKNANIIRKTFQKCNLNIKNAEFNAEIESIEKVKELMQKSYQRKSDRKIQFLTFITVCKIFWPITFFGWTFLNFFFQRLWTQHPIWRFLLPIRNFVTKHINFDNFKAESRRNGSKIQKSIFWNVSQNPILHSFSFREATCVIKVKIVVSYWTVTLMSRQKGGN